MTDSLISFHLKGSQTAKSGELVLMRVSAILCLFPEHHQIRTIEHGWTVEVMPEDWAEVEAAFRL